MEASSQKIPEERILKERIQKNCSDRRRWNDN
jgi:hypothetical protein